MDNYVSMEDVLCRTCLKTDPNTLNIFGHYKDDKLISEVLAEFINLEMQEDDGFPTHICKNCLEKLNVVCDFKTTALESYRKLCSSYNLAVKIKEESSDVQSTASEVFTVKDGDEETKIKLEINDVNLHENLDTEDYAVDIGPMNGKDYENPNKNTDKDRIQNEKDQEDNTELTNPKDEENLDINSEAEQSFDTSEYEKLKNSLTWKEKEKARLHCKICDKELSFRYFFATHLRAHQGALPYGCLKCKRRFSTPSELKTHNLRRHEDKRPFKCKTCDKTFKTISELHIHQRVHSDEIYICKICDKKFKWNSYLKQHMEQHQAGRKEYFCEICGKMVLNLRTHQVIHNSTHSFTCPECGKHFKTKVSLSLHVKTHSDVRNHVCSDCGKAFKKLSTLKEHQRKHSGIKPYACKVCEKSFNDSGTLSRHKLTHTKEHHYACQTCEKTFRYSQQLKNHMKNNH